MVAADLKTRIPAKKSRRRLAFCLSSVASVCLHAAVLALLAHAIEQPQLQFEVRGLTGQKARFLEVNLAPRIAWAAKPAPKREAALAAGTESHTRTTFRLPEVPVAAKSSKQAELIGDISNLIELGNTANASGVLTFRLVISRLGRVASVEVLRSTLPREIEGAIVLRFYLANYRPGEVDGTPVDSELVIAAELHNIGTLPDNPKLPSPVESGISTSAPQRFTSRRTLRPNSP